MKRARDVLVVLMAIGLLAAAPAGRSVGEKIVGYARERMGKQVGNGECAVLVVEALKAAGAQGRGRDHPGSEDYTWGKLVLLVDAAEGKQEGDPGKLEAGDIIQFRNAKFEGRRGNMHYTFSFVHHTSIVTGVEESGRVIRVVHQNVNGKRTVQEGKIELGDLQEGWIRVYRPRAAG